MVNLAFIRAWESVIASMEKLYWLILGGLSVWRITHLFVAEEGPFRIFARLRQFAGGPLRCSYCFSLTASVPFALIAGQTWTERMFLWLAFSGAAILLERATAEAPLPQYVEDPANAGQEENHELLRTNQTAAEHAGAAGARDAYRAV